MASGGAAPGAASTVDWQQQVADLCGSEDWRSLLDNLAAAPGGPAVSALLRRSAAAATAAVQAGSGGSSSKIGTVRLAEVVQQVAWEKLHTGDWHTVPLVWRDAYAAACILAAAAGLPSRGGGDEQQLAPQLAESGGAETTASDGGEAAALGAALWHLDMAAIMGGALLRRRVDALIDALQRRWQTLHAAAAWQPQAAQSGGEASGGPPAKRARGEEAAAAGPEPAAAADDAAVLPPGSLGPRGTPVPVAELPSLEAFWRDHMAPGTPVVITGEPLLLAFGLLLSSFCSVHAWLPASAGAAVHSPGRCMCSELAAAAAPACLPQAAWRTGRRWRAGQTPATSWRWRGRAPCLWRCGCCCARTSALLLCPAMPAVAPRLCRLAWLAGCQLHPA